MIRDINLWFRVEQEIANLLIDRLEHLQISPEWAAEIARFVVESIPNHMTDQQMAEIIPKLDDEFTELSSIVHKHMQETDKTVRQKQLKNTRVQLQQYLQKRL